MVEWLERLLDHLEWANGRALEAVRRSGNGRAHGLLAHVLATERVWLTRIRTGDSSGLEIWPDFTLEECEDLMRENLEAYRRFLDSRSVEDLRETAAYQNSGGTEFRTPVGEILVHVALHGSYHRGQIATEIRQSGGEPVNTDFITYVRDVPAVDHGL